MRHCLSRILPTAWQIPSFYFCALMVTLGGPAHAQITNLTATTSTPFPGPDHGYLKLLNETVDPATGSVNLRNSLPVPPGRQLTLPFSISYNSNYAGSLYTVPTGGITFGYQNSYLSRGGWSYNVPTFTFVQTSQSLQDTGSYPPKTWVCDDTVDYMYFESNGDSHPLNMTLKWADVSAPSDSCTHTALNITPRTAGGDGPISSSQPVHGTPMTITDADGTVVSFETVDHSLGGGGGANTYLDLPYTITDRNGNIITVNDNSGTDLPPFTGPRISTT